MSRFYFQKTKIEKKVRKIKLVGLKINKLIKKIQVRQQTFKGNKKRVYFPIASHCNQIKSLLYNNICE